MIAVVLCLVARIFSILPCGLLVEGLKNMESEPHKLGWKRLIMMWHSGLRGGIALVLALEVNAKWCLHKDLIVNGTFVVICVMLLLLGGSTETVLGLMGIQTHVKAADEALIVKDRYYIKLLYSLNRVGN